MRALQARAEAIVRADPAVAHVSSSVGFSGPWANSNNGRFFVALKPRAERKIDAGRVAARLSAAASTIPGLSAYFGAVQDVRIGGRPGQSEYQFTLWSADLPTLRAVAPEGHGAPAPDPGAARRHGRPADRGFQIDVRIDREAAGPARRPHRRPDRALNTAPSRSGRS